MSKEQPAATFQAACRVREFQRDAKGVLWVPVELEVTLTTKIAERLPRNVRVQYEHLRHNLFVPEGPVSDIEEPFIVELYQALGTPIAHREAQAQLRNINLVRRDGEIRFFFSFLTSKGDGDWVFVLTRTTVQVNLQPAQIEMAAAGAGG